MNTIADIIGHRTARNLIADARARAYVDDFIAKVEREATAKRKAKSFDQQLMRK